MQRVSAIQHRLLQANGLRMHIAEQGSGPLVLFCHGWPESWYSWRHQLPALAAAGYHAVAPDMRGYGQTDAPEAIDQYTLLHLVGDMVGLLDALGEETAVIVGHDWGAPVAWHAALLRPDRFPPVAALSVPYRPRGAVRPTSVMPQTEDAWFYQLYFQPPGLAEAEFERDIPATMRGVLDGGSAAGPRADAFAAGMVPRTGGFVTGRNTPEQLPGWLSEADIGFYAGEFASSGFRGGLNWYRNIDRNWELLASFAGAHVTVPALYVAGVQDLVLRFPCMRDLIDRLTQFVPQLREIRLLPHCGHWTQQEQPAEVNAALLAFLRSLPIVL